MRTALTILLALHAALHGLGFVKWSELLSLPQLSGRTLVALTPTGQRIFALLWLLVGLILLTAAALRVLSHDAWWVFALAGVMTSQGLVGFAWHDAKFGTLANVLILVPALVGYADSRFERRVEVEIRQLLVGPSASQPSRVEPAELKGLPVPVRSWLERSGIVGRERARTVRLRQRGWIRTSSEGAWMPARAEQYFFVEEPAFIWKVNATALGFVPISGRDKYHAGSGEMRILAGSIVPLVKASDDRIAHGALLRFLAEIIWFPSAALGRHIQWKPVDGTHAEVTLRHAGLEATATFTFSPEGRVLGMTAERYLGSGVDAKLLPWTGSCSAFRVVRGVEIPTQGQVSWRLESGDFTYYRWEILDVEENRPASYRKEPNPHVRATSRGDRVAQGAPARPRTATP